MVLLNFSTSLLLNLFNIAYAELDLPGGFRVFTHLKHAPSETCASSRPHRLKRVPPEICASPRLRRLKRTPPGAPQKRIHLHLGISFKYSVLISA